MVYSLVKNAAVLLDVVGEYMLGVWWSNIKFLAFWTLLTTFVASAGSIAMAAGWVAKRLLQGAYHIALSTWGFARCHRTAHDVRRAVAGDTPVIRWAGASAPEPYSLDFIRDRVRGRGERRQPHRPGH